MPEIFARPAVFRHQGPLSKQLNRRSARPGRSFGIAAWAAPNWWFCWPVGPAAPGLPEPIGGLTVAEVWRPSRRRLGRRMLGGGRQRPDLGGARGHREAFAVVDDLQWLAV